ncbi:MAG: DUF3047 domain-containing protein [Lentisphaeria bacterium]|nr:DUF3047 domain-containing protein [Lentisphaeria bacterium]
MKRFLTLVLFLFFCLTVFCSDRKAALRYDFSDPAVLKRSWEFHGGLLMIPRTVFKIEKITSAVDGMALVVEAKSSTGVLMTDPKIDLKKYPILRWRWRIIRQVKPVLPEPDDQAAVIYLGDGTMIRQKSIGYRWEHHTPVGHKKDIKYSGGMMHVKASCIRNKKTETGRWVIEEVDVLADFIRAYKRFPGNYFVLGVGGNSQYTGSNTRVEIDYIEFLPRKKDSEAKK